MQEMDGQGSVVLVHPRFKFRRENVLCRYQN